MRVLLREFTLYEYHRKPVQSILFKVGRYEVKEEIRHGGMSTVYRAYDPQFEREVALKILPRELMHDPSFRTRFEREAKIIASLEHSAIVPMYDYGEEDGQPFLVMRYMSGGSLEDRLAEGPISLVEAARIFARLAPALDEAHKKGIVHRDLKPANILFDHNSDPYLTDFGIAKMASVSSTLTGNVIVGTPAFMSPEQARGVSEIDNRSDIYSLGAILFEMLTGRVPYEADTPVGQIIRHINDPVPDILSMNDHFPPSLQLVIMRSMAKQPHSRYPTATMLAQAIRSIALGKSPIDPIQSETRVLEKTEELTAAMTPTAETSQPRLSQRQRRTILYSGIVAATVLGLVIITAVVNGFMNNPLGGMFFPQPSAAPSEPIVAAAASQADTQTPTVTSAPTSESDLAGGGIISNGYAQVIDVTPGMGFYTLNGRDGYYLEPGQQIPAGEQVILWTTSGTATLELSDQSSVILDENSSYHLLGVANPGSQSNQTTLSLDEARCLISSEDILVKTQGANYTVEGFYAIMGITYQPDEDLFIVDCLVGTCLIGPKPILTLQAGQRAGYNQGNVVPIEGAQMGFWSGLDRSIGMTGGAAQTNSLLPSVTPRHIPTNTQSPAQSTSVGTNPTATRVFIPTPTETPIPVQPVTNTPPPTKAPTSTTPPTEEPTFTPPPADPTFTPPP